MEGEAIKFSGIDDQGFFSKFLMGGTQFFSSPSVPVGDEVKWGGTYKKFPAEAKISPLS